MAYNTGEEITKVHKTLTFGIERAAVNNLIARRIVGLEADTQGYSALRIFDQAEIKNIARSTLKYVWGWFTDIGMVMSGVIGIYVVVKAIKYTLNVIINGMAIYKAVGCGVTLVASLWNTLAVWVVSNHHNRKVPPEEAIDVPEVIVDRPPRPEISREPKVPTLHPIEEQDRNLEATSRMYGSKMFSLFGISSLDSRRPAKNLKQPHTLSKEISGLKHSTDIIPGRTIINPPATDRAGITLFPLK